MSFVVSFLAGVLVEVLTGVVIGALVGLGLSPDPRTGVPLPAWVGIVAAASGAIFTFALARWRTSRVPDRFVAHGLTVAGAAVALHLATAAANTASFGAIHVVADVLKLAAGWAAGVLAKRRRATATA